MIRDYISRRLRNFLSLLVFISLFIFVGKTNAHPLDVTKTYFYLKGDPKGNQIENNQMYADVQISWFQTANLIEEDFGDSNVIEMAIKNKDMFEDIINEKLIVKNNGFACPFELQEIPWKDEDDLYLTGVSFLGIYNCNEEISRLDFENYLFINVLPTQQNYMIISQRPGQTGKDLVGKILTPTRTSMSLRVGKGEVFKNIRENLLSGGRGSELVSKVDNLLEKNDKGMVFLILGISVIVGALHTFEGGHSKMILTAMMINNKLNLKKGFIYVTIFTLTHISDIIIFGLALLVFDSIGNVYEIMSGVQNFALYVMFFLAGSMFLRELGNIVKHSYQHKKNITHGHSYHEHDHNHGLGINKSFKDQLTIAFLEGLAPCLLGWAIFMLVVSSGKLWLIIPTTFAFGLGVFITLTIYMLLLQKFKNAITKRISWFSKYSALISATLLLITIIFLLF